MLGAGPFDVIPARAEETPPLDAGPAETVLALSKAKAEEVSGLCSEDSVVIAADTIVWFQNRIYGKPRDTEEAIRMLSELSDHTHEVYTGVTVISSGKVLSEYERSEVTFRNMDRNEIEAYVACGEPMDKAGAYGAQGIGSVFVKEIKGDFFNVMGLPTCRLYDMLRRLGVNLL